MTVEKHAMIYVASPYSHDSKQIMHERYLDVMEYCHHLLLQGHFPFSPIVYGHELALRHDLPTDAEFWWNFNEAFMRRANCLHVYCLPGWKESKGVKKEIEYAEEKGIPIVYLDSYAFRQA
jgi:hypothetical protein